MKTKKLISLLLIFIAVASTMVSCIPNLLDPTPGEFTYNDFNEAEKQIMLTYLGELIPFLPTDDYTFGEYKAGWWLPLGVVTGRGKRGLLGLQ